jgi:hypothetical protein
MKSTVIDEQGDVRCPVCGAVNSFTVKRTGKAKLVGGLAVGVGALAAPKRLQCNGCGTNLKRGSASKPNSLASRAEKAQQQRQDFKRNRKARRSDEALSPAERAATYGNPLDRWFAKRRFERQAARESSDR